MDWCFCQDRDWAMWPTNAGAWTCVNQKSWMFYGMIHWSIQQGCTKMHNRYCNEKESDSGYFIIYIFPYINFCYSSRINQTCQKKKHTHTCFFIQTRHFCATFSPPTSTSDFLEVNRTFRIVLILIPFSTGLWRKSLHPTRPRNGTHLPLSNAGFIWGVVNVVGCARNRLCGESFSGRIFDRTSRRSRSPNCLRRHVLLILMGRAGWCLIWGLG